MITRHNNLSVSSRQAALRPCQRIGLATHLARKRTVRVAARLTAKGKVISADQLVVKKSLGEGSYGQVFEGMLDTGTGVDERVVLKRTKARVEGAAEMAQMEHIINVYASKAAKGSIAEFLGYCEVRADQANYRLTEGLWLMWRYEGQNTLAYYLRRRDTLRSLARDLNCPEEIVVPVAMRHLLLGLSALHNAGLVHRDVKPLNIIASERDARLKLIDLGAAADLRTGTNYSPEESILDPMYCPPEQYVLPTDSPHLAKSAFAIALSPMLWAQHKPDRFDSWSAGIVLLQLALPGLRQPRGLNLFKSEFERADYDIFEWKDNCRWISKRDTAVLDANNGVGWELAQALLRPRSIRVDDDGRVSFVSQAGFSRIGAQEALKHPFLRPAAEYEKSQAQALRRGLLSSASSMDESMDEGPSRSRTGSGSSSREARKLAVASNGRSGSGSGGRSRSGSGGSSVKAGSSGRVKGTSGSWWGRRSRSGSSSANVSDVEDEDDEDDAAAAGGTGMFDAASGLWRGLQDKLFDLEARVIKTASRTAKQNLRVNQLEEKVARGQADAAALAKAKNKLGQMQQQLDTLEEEKQQTASRASNLLSFLGIGGSKQKQKQQAPPPEEPKRSGSGSSRSGWQGLISKSRGSAAAPAPPAAEASSSSSSGGTTNVLVQAWERLGQQLSKMEGQLNEQQSRTERQKVSVQKLQQQVRAGEASSSELEQEQEKLGQMSVQLEGLQGNYNKVKDQAAALLQRIQTATSSSPSSTASEPAEPKTTTTSSSSRSGVGGAVTGAVSAGFKFSNLAMRIANNVVSSVKDDANKFLREIEQEAEAKRARKAAEAAFLQLLRIYTPNSTASPTASPAASPAPAAAAGGVSLVIAEDTTYEKAEEALGGLADWKAVTSSSRRREMYAAYIEALRQVAAERTTKAEKQLNDLLVKLNVGPESDWTEVSQVLAAHPLSSAIAPERRGELFDARVREVVLERACQAAAERADNDFRQLLQERASVGEINIAFTTWTTAKPVLWGDIRYQSLPEDRRLELFKEFMGVLEQQAAAKAAAAAAAAVPASSRPQSPQPPVAPPPAAAAAPAAASSSVDSQATAADKTAVPDAAAPNAPVVAAPAAAAAATPAVSAAPAFPAVVKAVIPAAAAASVDSSMDSLSSFDGGAMSDDEAGMSAEDLAALQLLRWEQAKLRADYEKMEAKLRAMENKIRSGSSSPVAGAPAAAAAAAEIAQGAQPALVVPAAAAAAIAETAELVQPAAVTPAGTAAVTVEASQPAPVTPAAAVAELAEGGHTAPDTPVAAVIPAAATAEPVEVSQPAAVTPAAARAETVEMSQPAPVTPAAAETLAAATAETAEGVQPAEQQQQQQQQEEEEPVVEAAGSDAAVLEAPAPAAVTSEATGPEEDTARPPAAAEAVDVAAAAPATDGDDGEKEGGAVAAASPEEESEGDVRMSVDEDGVMVFNFPETAAASSTRSSTHAE